MATPAIDFKRIPDGPIKEILLRFPCSASVACAVFFSWHLRRIVSNKDFLSLFRQRHPSSPLLGIFASSDKGRLPVFENVSSDTILNGVVCRADTGLAYLDKKKDWLLEDCLNGRLLLCSNDDSSFCIYDPLSQRRMDCGSRPYDDEGDYLNTCLLEVGGLSRHMVSVQQRGQSTKAMESSRFISLQRRARKPEVRAVEYNSGKLEWCSHPWKKLPELKWIGEAMHAAGHIFWTYSAAFLLVLDISTMKFSLEPLPWQFALTPFTIGELEDGKGCVVCLQGLNTPDINGPTDLQPHLKVRLQLWTIEKKTEKKLKTKMKEKEEEGIFDWEMKEEVLVSKILDKDAPLQYAVTKLVNGLVVICNPYTHGHYVINLHSMTQVAKFNNRGRRMAYLYQLPWPPSVLAGATTMPSIHNKHIAGDEVSKQCPNNNKDGPATTEERHIAGDEVSKQCPGNKDGLATTVERHIAGDEESKQCPSNNKDGPATTEERCCAAPEEKEIPRGRRSYCVRAEEELRGLELSSADSASSCVRDAAAIELESSDTPTADARPPRAKKQNPRYYGPSWSK